MLGSHSVRVTMDPYIQKRLKQFRVQGVTRVKAQASGRHDECASCRALNGIEYPIDEFPEYPPFGCSCPLGCGCVAVGLLKSPDPLARTEPHSSPAPVAVCLLTAGS